MMTQAFQAAIDSATVTEPAAVPALRSVVVSKLQDFHALRGELEELCNELCEDNVFYEPWMMVPALTHLDRGHALSFVCFYETASPGRLCGFFPLMRAPVHPLLPLSTYQSWTHPHCFRSTPLIRKGFAESCWSALFDWLERQPVWRRMLFVRRLLADGETAQALRQVLGRRPTLHYAMVGHETAFLRIAGDSDEVLRQAMSGSTLGKLRRQQRRLAECGEIVFSEVDDEPDLNHFLDEFLELETSGWKGQQGTAIACHANEEAFFRAVASAARDRGQLSLLSMRVGGKLLAAQCSLVSRHGSFLFKTTYDEHYSRYSPGVLLEIEHLRRMHDPKAPLRGRLSWSDSCAGPDDGPVYRCWPERRTVVEYRIACGWGPPWLIVTLWPLLRRIYLFLQQLKARQADAPPQPAQGSAKA